MRIFLTIPGVLGEVTSDPFKDSIECQSVSFEPRLRDDAGQQVAKGVPRIVELQKLWDRSSTFLGEALTKATTFPKATVTCANPDSQQKLVKQLVLDLTNAQILELGQAANDGGSPLPTEVVRLICASMTVAYSPQGISVGKTVTL